MGEPSGGEQINWNQSTPIAVPTPTTEARFAIRRSDWNRIRRGLLRCKEPEFNFSVWYSIFFGGAVSAGASIIPIGATKDLPVWVLPLYICGTGALTLLGAVFLLVDRYLKQQRRSQIEELDIDMHEIEQAFESQNIGTPSREGVV
jgi:hypothetical protein